MDTSPYLLEYTLERIDEAASKVLFEAGVRRVIAFYGAMGSGKTTLIKAVCIALGSTDATSSPTFALVNQYADSDGHPICHFDFYRIQSMREALDMGYEEYFYSGHYCLIEWPEKIEYLLPDDCVRVILEPGTTEHSRFLHIN